MMKLHIELPDAVADEMLEQALNGAGPSVRARAEKNDALRRALIRDAIIERLSQ